MSKQKAKPETPREYVSRPQAAEILGVSVRTIDRLVKRGKLTPRHSAISNHIFFDRNQVEAIKAEIIIPVSETK